MARMRFDVTTFIRDYTECVNAGLTLAEIGQVMGLRPSIVGQRARALARRGIPLPKRTHALKGKPGHPCPFKGQKLGPRKPKARRMKGAALTPDMVVGMPVVRKGSQSGVTVTPGFVFHVGSF